MSEISPTRLKKLTPEQVACSITLYKSGKSLQQVAEVMGVTRTAMWDLLRRRLKLRPQKQTGPDNHFYRGGQKNRRKKLRAQRRVWKAIQRGDLVRPTVCPVCGKTPKPYKDGRSAIQAHHDDYNKPLDVRWMCQPCHHELHRETNA